MSLTPLLISWAALTVFVIGLAIYRRKVASHEDVFLHVSHGDQSMINEQSHTAHQLEMVDKWGKILTVVAAVYGLAILALALYQQWVASYQTVRFE